MFIKHIPFSSAPNSASTSTGTRKSSLKNMYPIIEKRYTSISASTAVSTIERPFLVTDLITLTKVSSRYTTSNNWIVKQS